MINESSYPQASAYSDSRRHSEHVSKPNPIPGELTDKLFSRQYAKTLGVTRNQLRGLRITRRSSGLYSLTSHASSALDVAMALCREFDDSFVSHQTAAQLHGLWLPPYVDTSIPCISRGHEKRSLRRANVRCRTVKRVPLDTVLIDGVPVSSPARLLLELSAVLAFDDLIAFGDQLVRTPHPKWEKQSEPHTSVQQIRALLDLHPGNRYRSPALRALEHVRVGSDSAPETQLRLHLVRAGFPEPELQLKLDARQSVGWTADLGYSMPRIAIQYDGETHLDSKRQSRDNARDDAFASAGWIVIRANRDDLANGFRRVITQLRTAFQTRGVIFL